MNSTRAFWKHGQDVFVAQGAPLEAILVVAAAASRARLNGFLVQTPAGFSRQLEIIAACQSGVECVSGTIGESGVMYQCLTCHGDE